MKRKNRISLGIVAVALAAFVVTGCSGTPRLMQGYVCSERRVVLYEANILGPPKIILHAPISHTIKINWIDGVSLSDIQFSDNGSTHTVIGDDIRQSYAVMLGTTAQCLESTDMFLAENRYRLHLDVTADTINRYDIGDLVRFSSD